nr:MAG: NS1 [Parvovirinae sp.]
MDRAREWLDANWAYKCLHLCFKVPEIIYRDADGLQKTITFMDCRDREIDIAKLQKDWGQKYSDVHGLKRRIIQSMNVKTEHEFNEDMRQVNSVLHAGVFMSLSKWMHKKQLEFDNCKMYMQTEISKNNGWHCHLLIGDGENVITQKSGKWIQADFVNNWRMYLDSVLGKPNERGFVNEAINNYTDIDGLVAMQNYRHSQTKKHYTEMVGLGSMIARYFFGKYPFTLTWYEKDDKVYIDGADSEHVVDELDFKERLAIWQSYQPEQTETFAVEVQSGRDKAVKENKSTKSATKTHREITYQSIIDKAIEHGIVDPDEFETLFFDDYAAVICKPAGEQLWKNIWQTIHKKLARTTTAFDWIMLKRDDLRMPVDPELTKLGYIAQRNGYNPVQLVHMIMCWANKKNGKRNTLLLHGPGSTGKSLIAQSLNEAVGLFGNYNHTNENFPWNDCANKLTIWVEECPNLGKQVETFKTLMSGQKVRIDQKGKGSIELQSTPVIITTNNDIDIVQIGALTQPQHAEPIKLRCCRVLLNDRLPEDFGLIDSFVWGDMFQWMIDHNYKPELDSYLSIWKQGQWTWNNNKYDSKPKQAKKRKSATSLLKGTPTDKTIINTGEELNKLTMSPPKRAPTIYDEEKPGDFRLWRSGKTTLSEATDYNQAISTQDWDEIFFEEETDAEETDISHDIDSEWFNCPMDDE